MAPRFFMFKSTWELVAVLDAAVEVSSHNAAAERNAGGNHCASRYGARV